MAIVSPIFKSTIESRKTLSESKEGIKKLTTLLEKRQKVKREAYAKTNLFRQKRENNDRRQQLEDELEAPKIVVQPGGPAKLIQEDNNRGFFDRILGFIGYLAAGWIMNNLPTWIGIGKEFIARLKRAGEIVSGFFGDTVKLFTGFGNLLSAAGENLMRFDFFDTSNRIKNAMQALNFTVGDMGNKIEEAYGLATTPLTEGKYSGEDIPGLGTQQTNEGAYEEPAPYTGTPGAASKLAETASQMKGFSSAAGPGGGNVACVWAVNQVYKKAGLTPPWGTSEYVPDAEKAMIKNGYIEVPENGRQPGDIYIAYDRGSPPQTHIGIVLANGNILSNSSSGAKFSWEDSPDGYARIYRRRGKFYRAPESQQKTSPNANQSIASTSNQMLVRQPKGTNAGTLTTPQLVSLAKQAGMDKNVNVKGYSGPLSVLMGAVGMQESSGNTRSMRRDTQVYGLWQIRWPVHASNLRKIGITSPEQLYDPLLNAKAAKMIYDRQGITAWSGFTDGNYKKFLPEAQKASGISPSSFSELQQPSVPAQIEGELQQAQISVNPQEYARWQSIISELTPERRGQDIIIAQPRNQQQIITSSGGGGQQAPSPINEFDLLNNFIKNKLLLDLAYL